MNPTSSAAVKQRQLAHLASQFSVLAQRYDQLERLTVTTAEQASYMRLLAAYHSSWYVRPSSGPRVPPACLLTQLTAARCLHRFMAAGRVMVNTEEEEGATTPTPKDGDQA